jgi:hypothetical protein
MMKMVLRKFFRESVYAENRCSFLRNRALLNWLAESKVGMPGNKPLSYFEVTFSSDERGWHHVWITTSLITDYKSVMGDVFYFSKKRG